VVIGSLEQVQTQAIAVGATIAYTAVATLVILGGVAVVFGLRVTQEEEREGLDVVLHGERLM
jgi:Amt family ammonium transporter